MSFTEYINLLKVSASIECILQHDKNISEAAMMCGFNTIRNFNRVFKKITGYTPKELPDNYVIPYKRHNEQGINPTINTTAIID